ncbi:MAG TPA: PIN domain-containing protein [Solirubrobacterales bacterium]
MSVAESRGILDTSTMVQLRRIPDGRDLPAEPLITTVTLAELAVGPLIARDDNERVRRQVHLQHAESDYVALPFDEAAARAFASVAASLRGAGRKVSARTFDALIAAVAISTGLPVHTCNPRDFEGIDRLEVVPVAVPK